MGETENATNTGARANSHYFTILPTPHQLTISMWRIASLIRARDGTPVLTSLNITLEMIVVDKTGLVLQIEQKQGVKVLNRIVARRMGLEK